MAAVAMWYSNLTTADWEERWPAAYRRLILSPFVSLDLLMWTPVQQLGLENWIEVHSTYTENSWAFLSRLQAHNALSSGLQARCSKKWTTLWTRPSHRLPVGPSCSTNTSVPKLPSSRVVRVKSVFEERKPHVYPRCYVNSSVFRKLTSCS